jgi:DNA ligase D-like protein (predicted 3'-phosphoesterase)
MASSESRAIRAVVTGGVQGVGFRDSTRRRASSLGLMGWVRNRDDGTVAVHAEGSAAEIEALIGFLEKGPRGADVTRLAVEQVPLEGHEQFAIRGVAAGAFRVRQQAGPTHRFELQLEVEGTMRTWAIPRGPSLDPAVKRLAVQSADQAVRRDSQGRSSGEATATVWDRGPYEQGGRVAWPEALERGHAVFVLHGQKLRGGFALQRTRPGPPAQWLLVKRRDDEARPGSDVVAEQP